ncbi:MAG: SBBP repeat-containing protein [Dehalococcoidia bacterium]
MWKRLAIWASAVLAIAAVAIALINVAGEQLLPETWVARYDGSSSSHDEALALAVDASGNVYVAGFSVGSGAAYDYATVKYDSDGNQLWVARYDGPAGGNDKVYAIAVDGSGNVYITGESEGDGTLHDYATVKYDNDGNQLWVARYDGPASGSDGASAIAVDGDGNVYVAGYSSGYGSDYATIKYDSDGNQLWVARYNGPRDSGDYATALAVDSMGNIYVTGYSLGDGTAFDYATVKYDSEGNQLWATRYDGPASRDDEAHAMAVSSSGNVYVTGHSKAGDDNVEYATIGYDSEGNQLWVARYNKQGGGQARANDVAIDGEGNVFVTGSSRFTVKDYVTSDSATVKYDPQGNQLWAARYNSPEKLEDGTNAIAVDGEGNIYVTGSSASIGSYADCITVKYASDGNQLWVARYNGPRSGADSAHAIAVDGDGNVYITGYSYGDDSLRDFATIKYAR